MKSLNVNSHLILIDGSGMMHRGFHAAAPMTRKDGLPVGGVAAFASMLFKLLRNESISLATHIAVVFDVRGKNFRHDIYPEYKSNRSAPRPELVAQFPLFRRAVTAFGVTAVEQQYFEADDLIATYARAAGEAGCLCTIVSIDKDLMQLARRRTVIYDPVKDLQFNAGAVMRRTGVAAPLLADAQALSGDPTDHVPGVPGVGEKTALALVAEFGPVESVIAAAGRGEVKGRVVARNLVEHADLARLSKRLVTLDDDVLVDVPVEAFAARSFDTDRVVAFCDEMEIVEVRNRIRRVMEKSKW